MEEKLHVLHLADPSSPVRALALISDLEEVSALGSDTVALLMPEVAQGGWMISAALRYAWERRACALIVPEQSFTQTVIQLARRLEVSLLTTSTDMGRLAIDTAIEIGMARAGSLGRIQNFTERVAAADDLGVALRLISEELGEVSVSVEVDGVVTAQVLGRREDTRERSCKPREPSVTEDGPGEGKVWVSVATTDSEADLLVAEIRHDVTAWAEQVLFAARPSVRALLAGERLRAARESLPLQTVAAFTGDGPGTGITFPEWERAMGEAAWPVRGSYVVVLILAEQPEIVGTAVHQMWREHVPASPLVRMTDGWLGFAPVKDGRARAHLVKNLRERLNGMRALRMRIGVSRQQVDPANAHLGVREAWLAARLTKVGEEAERAAITEVDQLDSRLVPLLLPADLAQQIGSLMLPELLRDPAARELIESVVAYLAHRGSISRAAESLGVHRNTLQSRLRRAEQLGVRLTDPRDVLGTHLTLEALRNSSLRTD